METLIKIFGEGKDLNFQQMCCRGFVIFIIAWLLIRLSGRRSFGLGRPLDNIIVILLGAILSRAVAGASPFIPTIGACLVIVLMHRLCAKISIHNRRFSSIVNGDNIILYKDGAFNKENMDKCLVRKEDLEETVRLRASTDDLENIRSISMEKNGELSAVKKEE
jgi:uncharacterized membrane protein YcaP (DUF421 family)